MDFFSETSFCFKYFESEQGLVNNRASLYIKSGVVIEKYLFSFFSTSIWPYRSRRAVKRYGAKITMSNLAENLTLNFIDDRGRHYSHPARTKNQVTDLKFGPDGFNADPW